MTGTCPSCGYCFDTATSLVVEGAKPKPGDLSLCLNCGELLEFNDRIEPLNMAIATFNSLPTFKRRLLLIAQRKILERGLLHPPA